MPVDKNNIPTSSSILKKRLPYDFAPFSLNALISLTGPRETNVCNWLSLLLGTVAQLRGKQASARAKERV